MIPFGDRGRTLVSACSGLDSKLRFGKFATRCAPEPLSEIWDSIREVLSTGVAPFLHNSSSKTFPVHFAVYGNRDRSSGLRICAAFGGAWPIKSPGLQELRATPQNVLIASGALDARRWTRISA
jgi:hypothetical protein